MLAPISLSTNPSSTSIKPDPNAAAGRRQPPNPHRPQSRVRPPRGSFPGGFRTPALALLATSRPAGIRNPSQELTWMPLLGYSELAQVRILGLLIECIDYCDDIEPFT
jgi:hypothetical protein